jgi:hypothetical protein
VAAIAELRTERPTPQSGGRVGLPPGSVPVAPVRAAIRRYRAGIGTTEHLIASVDRHGDALEREIARKAVDHLADFHRTVNRLDVLAGYVETRLAQLEWLRSFPTGPARQPEPLSCPIGGGRRVEVSDLLSALRAVELPPRVVLLGPHVRRLDGRRGAAPSMASLADAGVSVTDVALELGIDRGRAWSMLNGHERVAPGLRPALERLVGADEAAVVLDGIPQHPRARQAASRAVEALHAAGATADDIAPLIPASPSTVRRWLRGTLRPSPPHAAALASALEQLLGTGPARELLALIPNRTG